MQAIVTRYIGPTDTKGARIKATAYAGSVTIPWSAELDIYENHYKAAMCLAFKFAWEGKLVGGSMPDDKGYAFVFIGHKGG